MKLTLNENIRDHRKQMKLTQEQLAEAMGVSVGTVSKWESGFSNPDIELIAELAEFFQTSVDVLLGYGWEKKSMGQTTTYLKELRNERRFAEGVIEARKALQKYPNSFQVIYESAEMYYYAGLNRTNQQHHNEEEMKQYFEMSQKLFVKSLDLFGQNSDKDISRESIHQKIGNLYGFIGQKKIAIDYLMDHNCCDANNLTIGHFLCDLREYDEAKKYITKVFRDSLMDLLGSYEGMFNILVNTKQLKEALSLSEWIRECFVKAANENSSYLYRIICIIDTLMATIYVFMRDHDINYNLEKVKEKLREAFKNAIRFDDNPDYLGKIRFFEYDITPVHDSLGDTAMEGIKSTVMCSIDDEVEFETLVKAYNEVVKEWNLDDRLLIGGDTDE